MTSFGKATKILVAGLLVAAASLTFVANGYAATRTAPHAVSSGEKAWMNHASQNVDGGNGS